MALLLQRAREGDERAASEAIQAIYGELNRLARRQMRRERGGHTLEPTALVHEAWMRMVAGRGDGPEWANRGHFLAVAAKLMRQVLVDHARRKRADKRGGMRRQTTLGSIEVRVGGLGEDRVMLDEFLERLAETNGRAGQIAEMYLLAGMTFGEIGEELGISERTVKRSWSMARAWWLNETSKRQ